MKKFGKRHFSTLFLMVLIVGTALVFQNFTKYDPMKSQKADDLFMSGALTTALKEAEVKEKKKLAEMEADANTASRSGGESEHPATVEKE